METLGLIAVRNHNPGQLAKWGQYPVVDGLVQFPDEKTGMLAFEASVEKKIAKRLRNDGARTERAFTRRTIARRRKEAGLRNNQAAIRELDGLLADIATHVRAVSKTPGGLGRR